MTLHTVTAWLLVLLVLLVGCTGEPAQEAATPAPSPEAAPAPEGPASPDVVDDGVPPLAEAPGGDVSLWLDTIGIPVVAAVRTSTPLADLDAVAPDERAAA